MGFSRNFVKNIGLAPTVEVDAISFRKSWIRPCILSNCYTYFWKKGFYHPRFIQRLIKRLHKSLLISIPLRAQVRADNNWSRDWDEGSRYGTSQNTQIVRNAVPFPTQKKLRGKFGEFQDVTTANSDVFLSSDFGQYQRTTASHRCWDYLWCWRKRGKLRLEIQLCL